LLGLKMNIDQISQIVKPFVLESRAVAADA
jgi:hypothetical protein